jgi:hypothetical protein
MQIIKATGLHRKSGGAQWRDLRFAALCCSPRFRDVLYGQSLFWAMSAKNNLLSTR